MSENTPKKCAWVTLLSDKAYVPGCLILLSSLKDAGTKYPLVIMVFPLDTPEGAKVSSEYRDLLKQAGCVIREIENLVPALGGYTGTQIRYVDIWAKLRAFALSEYERVVLIDSDMLVRKNMDELLDMPLDPEWIAATHACTCNPLRISHYPPEWSPATCAHTHARPADEGSDALCIPFQPGPDRPAVPHDFGSGLVVLTPGDDAHKKLVEALHNDPKVSTYPFADQDFLCHYFKDRVKYLGYEYNAVKPMRECHKELWRDEGVRNVHYVLKDKPWSIPEGSPALEEQFRVVHGWWWDEWRKIESKYGKESWWNLVEPLVESHTTATPHRRTGCCILW